MESRQRYFGSAPNFHMGQIHFRTLWSSEIDFFSFDIEITMDWGAWVAQSVKRPTSAQVREFESCIGLCADSSEPGACFRFCVSLSLTLPRSCSVSVSKINVKKKKKEITMD